MLPEQLEKIRACDHLIVGAEQNARNRQLNAARAGLREQARQVFQALAVSDPLARQRIQRAGLRFRVGHSRDARGDFAKLVRIGDRTMAQIHLRDVHIIVIRTGQRAQNPPVTRSASQARENGCTRRSLRLRR